MNCKFSLGLAAALGLTTLVATAFAQRFGSDQQSAVPAGDSVRFVGQASADIAPNPFGAAGQSRRGATPEEVNLSTEVGRLARQFGQAKTGDEKDKLKGKIADALDKQFDQRQRRHESEIEALEAQVKKLKELVRLRSEKRREIVAKRLEQVQRDAEGLGW